LPRHSSFGESSPDAGPIEGQVVERQQVDADEVHVLQVGRRDPRFAGRSQAGRFAWGSSRGIVRRNPSFLQA